MSECVICLNNIHIGKKKLKCGHTFHKKCIKTWLKDENTCPICRKEIKKKYKRKIIKKSLNCVMCRNITNCVTLFVSSPFLLCYAFYKELQDSTVRRRRGRN